LLLTAEVKQVSCNANKNWRRAVKLLPRPDVVQVTLLSTTDLQHSILLTKADKLFRH